MLHGSQAGLQSRRKAVPEILGNIPEAEMGRVEAESISIFDRRSAG
jgi:hypothetical protein